LLLATAAAVAALALTAASAQGDIWQPEPARGVGPQGPCPQPAARLAPNRDFTFVYRLQRAWDVELMANEAADHPAQLPIADRDLFMVRARGDSADWSTEMLDHLGDPAMLSGELFRCNRVVSLTGARAAPGIAGERFDRLAGDPRVWGVAPDWERPMFRLAYPDTPGQDAADPEPEWTHDFGANVGRLGQRAGGIHGTGKRAGAVVTGAHARNAWDFGRLAKLSGLDYQVVQIQGDCLRSPQAFGDRAHRLLHEYRAAGLRTSSLAIEVSFSSNPGATAWPADVTPQRAARCTRAAYAAGARGVLLWAQPDVLDEYFAALPDSIRA
jgi:hypothetical protein